MQDSVRRRSTPIYRAAQVRMLDRLATERHGIASYDLMGRAAVAALRVLREQWPGATSVTVCCGAGNNAGDGYLLARLAHAEGSKVRVVAVGPPERLKGDARQAHAECTAAGVPIERFDAGETASLQDSASGESPIIVDALLGIGAERPLDGDFAAAVAAINSARQRVLALDVPSGLHADTGWPLGDAVRATVTVTFVGLKQGLYLGEACDYVGRVELADLALPEELRREAPAPLQLLGREELTRALPPRARSAHKGTSGRLLVVGGGPSMPGAVRLAAEAALRSGAGLVYAAVHPDNVAAVLAGRPEVIARSVAEAADIDDLIASADAAVLGPGLGQSAWARALWRRLLDSDLPLVVDADALNLLAGAPERRGNWILTPHPGEAARLAGVSIDDVQRDRADSARSLAARFGAIVVLKGARSLIAVPDAAAPLAVCSQGNPGMATAGMGDVLAGVLGALAVQTRDLEVSARAGVLLHALAGDSAAAAGERGTVASDLLPYLRTWANPS